MEKKDYLIEMKYHYTIPLRELHQGLGFLVVVLQLVLDHKFYHSLYRNPCIF
jgi:hypothetical protein